MPDVREDFYAEASTLSSLDVYRANKECLQVLTKQGKIVVAGVNVKVCFSARSGSRSYLMS